MYAGPDAMDWEDDVDMYGGASSTSAALIGGPETPSGKTEKKQEARRMKEQAASDRMQRMTACPGHKLPELFGKYILGREPGQEVATYDTMQPADRLRQIYEDTANAMCWWRGEQSHHGGTSMAVSVLPRARTHVHMQHPLTAHTRQQAPHQEHEQWWLDFVNTVVYILCTGVWILTIGVWVDSIMVLIAIGYGVWVHDCIC